MRPRAIDWFDWLFLTNTGIWVADFALETAGEHKDAIHHGGPLMVRVAIVLIIALGCVWLWHGISRRKSRAMRVVYTAYALISSPLIIWAMVRHPGGAGTDFTLASYNVMSTLLCVALLHTAPARAWFAPARA